jgi:RimJ/RimL family protein N-acetyltransferase
VTRADSDDDRAPEPFTPIADARPHDAPWPAMAWPPTATRLVGHVVELTPCVPERDAAALFERLDDDALWLHSAGRSPDAASLAFSLAKRQAEGRFVWTVRLLKPQGPFAAGAVVGTTSYLEVSAPDARLEIGATMYARAAWASKVNPDTKRLLLEYAFDVLGAARVQLKTDVRNARSQQAIARLGARYEATLRRHQRRDDGTLRDTVLFSILAEEWPDVRYGLLRRLEAG